MPEELAELRRRANAFIDRHRTSPSYCFEGETGESRELLTALREIIEACARGETGVERVEIAARAYCLAHRRPGGVNEQTAKAGERGSPIPPAPPPGTYPARTQAAYRETIGKPPKALADTIDRSPVVDETEVAELTPILWRVAVLLIDHTPVSPTYFTEKPIDAGTVGYAKLNASSLRSFPERAELWAIQFLEPITGLSYYFRPGQVEAYQEAERQKAIEAAWGRGFVSRK